MKQPSSVTSVLRKNPNIKRELRPALEQALLEKLESLGVKPGLRGLGGSEYSDLMAKLRSERESTAKDIPDYWRHREDVALTLRLRLKDKRTESDSAPEQRVKPKQPTQVTQARQLSSSLSSKVTQVMSGPTAAPAKQLQTTPQPAPRTLTTTLPKTTPKTPPFSSDDESSSEEEEEEEPPQKPRQEQRVPHHRASQPKPTQPKITPHHKLTQSKPVQDRSSQPKQVQPITTQAQPYKPQQPRSTAVNTTKTAVTVVESEGEWTEGSELEEVDPQQLQNYKDQNGNVQKTTNNNLVRDLTKSLEKQLADRGPKKPLGGVSILPESKDKDVVRELKYTNEDDEDDWDISSLDDLSVPAPVGKPTAPVRKSLDSDSTTSVWGTSTGKGQKTGLNEAGTGSTLKSSLVSVSDWSDDDI